MLKALSLTVLMVSTLTLTGCSLTAQNDRYVIAPEVEQYKPTRPAALVLENEVFRLCEHEDPQQVVCLDRKEAEKIIRNKLKVAAYVKDANAVIDFYERSGSQAITK